MKKIIDILKEIKDEFEFENINDLIDGGYLDSFDLIQLITAIDEEYRISIPAIEITPENFNSIKAIEKMLERLKNE